MHIAKEHKPGHRAYTQPSGVNRRAPVRRKVELLESTGCSGRRWYVDGVQVSFARFYALEQDAWRVDTFTTTRKGARTQHRKTVTL